MLLTFSTLKEKKTFIEVHQSKQITLMHKKVIKPAAKKVTNKTRNC